MKYRPKKFDDIVLPTGKPDIIQSLIKAHNDGFIRGNMLASGEHGLGKTSFTELMARKVAKVSANVRKLENKKNSLEETHEWLIRMTPQEDGQLVVIIEEIDRLARAIQDELKSSGVLEKFQDRCTFLATTNYPERVDPALLDRFNIHIEFKDLPEDKIFKRMSLILQSESITYYEDDLSNFLDARKGRSLRSIISEAENISSTGVFNPYFYYEHENEPHALSERIYRDELKRLTAKYGRALNRDQVMDELDIKSSTMDTRLKEGYGLPKGVHIEKGKIIFPLANVAAYLASV